LLLFFARRITTVKMQYLRKSAGYTMTDYKTKEIAKKLNKAQVSEKYKITEEIAYNM
jgi:hypothetical protein